MSKRGVVALMGAFLLAGAVVGTGSAEGPNAATLFETGVEGIQVGGQAIAGIGGGAPWEVTAGQATIREDGQLTMEVEGLVLTTPIVAGDPVFPVLGVCGSLVCQKAEAGEPTNDQVATTGSFPLSAVTGNADIDETIELPDICVAPIVLVRVSAVDANFFTTGPDGCNGGAGPNCMPTGVPVEIGCNGPWIAASGF